MADKQDYSEEKIAVDHVTIFYATVGQGISFWASMEGTLVQIAAKLLGTSDEKAGLLLYSIMNFYSWLTIIDELFLLETKYADHKTEWGAITAKLRQLNDIRVRLAHHTNWDGSEEQGKTKLKPNRFDARSKSKKHTALTATEIVAFTGSVAEVEKQLNALLAAMKITDAKPPSPFQNILLRLSPDQPPPDGSQ